VARRKLPNGWSYPIEASETAELFPGVGHVYWNGRPANWQSAHAQDAFWLSWSPRSAMPQPVLTVWALPSARRAAVRRWIKQTVEPEASQWLRALDTRGQVWRDTSHSVAWSWTVGEHEQSGREVKAPSP
jgi:hypothetical protein